jgi:hypothetical protein
MIPIARARADQRAVLFSEFFTLFLHNDADGGARLPLFVRGMELPGNARHNADKPKHSRKNKLFPTLADKSSS